MAGASLLYGVAEPQVSHLADSLETDPSCRLTRKIWPTPAFVFGHGLTPTRMGVDPSIIMSACLSGWTQPSMGLSGKPALFFPQPISGHSRTDCVVESYTPQNR